MLADRLPLLRLRFGLRVALDDAPADAAPLLEEEDEDDEDDDDDDDFVVVVVEAEVFSMTENAPAARVARQALVRANAATNTQACVLRPTAGNSSAQCGVGSSLSCVSRDRISTPSPPAARHSA